jgi:Flp pilus assembly secretin CpaC
VEDTGFDKTIQHPLKECLQIIQSATRCGMLSKSGILALAILGFHAAIVSAQDYEIKINLYQGDPTGSREAGTIRLVSAPEMVTKSAEDASLLVGGQVAIGAKTVPVGRQVHINAKDAGEGAVRVKLILENSVLVGAKGAQVVSTKSETTAVVQSGSKIRLELGEDAKNKHWVEVTISKLK